ncbi:unnamed protein product, partial [marine sediment metagenome]
LSVDIAANTNYIIILTFGEYGNREGEFDYPVGIVIDKNSNLYITDWENDRIQKFNSEGRLLKVIPILHFHNKLKQLIIYLLFLLISI